MFHLLAANSAFDLRHLGFNALEYLTIHEDYTPSGSNFRDRWHYYGAILKSGRL